MSEENERTAAGENQVLRDLNLTTETSQLTEINSCAPCHSIRQKLSDDYIHGDVYMDHFDPLLTHPDNYFPDGQIREEVFVYGSFLQNLPSEIRKPLLTIAMADSVRAIRISA